MKIIDDLLQYNDDHRISAYLAKNGIDRIVVNHNTRDMFKSYNTNQGYALSTRGVCLFREHFQFMLFFKKMGLYNKSYKFNRSLAFYVLLLVVMTTVFLYIGIKYDKYYLAGVLAVWLGVYLHYRGLIAVEPYSK